MREKSSLLLHDDDDVEDILDDLMIWKGLVIWILYSSLMDRPSSGLVACNH